MSYDSSYDAMLGAIHRDASIEVAEAAGIPIEEAAAKVDQAFHALGLDVPERKLQDTPWEQIRKTPKPPKGLHWPATLAWYREHAHEVWQASNGWTYYVLKSYQRGRGGDGKSQYDRAFCLVDGFESELGDVYWRDVTQGTRIR